MALGVDLCLVWLVCSSLKALCTAAARAPLHPPHKSFAPKSKPTLVGGLQRLQEWYPLGLCHLHLGIDLCSYWAFPRSRRITWATPFLLHVLVPVLPMAEFHLQVSLARLTPTPLMGTANTRRCGELLPGLVFHLGRGHCGLCLLDPMAHQAHGWGRSS